MKQTLLLLLALWSIHPAICQEIETCITDGIEFTSQAQIDNFASDFPGCNTILGSVKVTGSAIQNLLGLHQITTIRGGFEISETQQLQGLAGINQVDSVYGNFTIQSNASLSIIDALDSLKYVGGSLLISNNSSLTAIQEVNDVNSIGISLRIIFNPGLTSISGFQQISVVNGNFSIGGSPVVTNINPLRIKSIKGNCAIVETNLNNLFWLDSLEQVEGFLNISNNPALENLSGLKSLQYINTDALISSNGGLTSLDGLQLDSIGGSISVANNTLLNDLLGLDSLKLVGGNLILENNPKIQSLRGLEALTVVKGTIAFTGNEILEDINSLSQIVPLELDDITIENCPQLSDCAIESICAYLADGRDAIFSNNADGCNSKEEVSTACLVGISDASHENSISVYPNPTFGQIYLQTELPNKHSIRIFNLQGQKLLYFDGNEKFLDLSTLPPGFYILQVQSGTAFYTGRVCRN